VENLRTVDKKSVLNDVYEMTNKRFEVARRLMNNKEWDFFMMVNIGTDRLHHALWAHHDTGHPKHDPESPFKNAVRDYYIEVDREIGELIKVLPKDTVIMIVSDHGIQRMNGGIALNDWLIQKGYLSLKEIPKSPVRLGKLISQEQVDWRNTVAWAWGGYSGKMFLNVKGREPQGIVPPGKVYHVLHKLKEEISQIRGENGEELNSQILVPKDIYKDTKGFPPDLIVQFDKLSWRVLGSVGNSNLWIHENDTGPDDANHAMDGVFASNVSCDIPSCLTGIRGLILELLKN